MDPNRMRWLIGCVLAVCGCTIFAKTLRDPTQPPGAKYELQAVNKNINIQAIYYSKDNPKVIVDGKSYVLGDTLSGAVITTINPTSMVLDGPAGDVEINMYPTIRKPAEDKKKKSSVKAANNGTKQAVQQKTTKMKQK